MKLSKQSNLLQKFYRGSSLVSTNSPPVNVITVVIIIIIIIIILLLLLLLFLTCTIVLSLDTASCASLTQRFTTS